MSQSFRPVKEIWIEQDLIPLENEELCCRRTQISTGSRGSDNIHRDNENPDRIGHDDTKSEHIYQVAVPLQRLTISTHFQSNDVVDRAYWSVISGNPFRVNQSEWTGAHRNGQCSMKHLAGNIGGVYRERNRLLGGRCKPRAEREHHG